MSADAVSDAQMGAQKAQWQTPGLRPENNGATDAGPGDTPLPF